MKGDYQMGWLWPPVPHMFCSGSEDVEMIPFAFWILVLWCCKGSGVTLWSAVHDPSSCSVSKPCFLLVLCNEGSGWFLYDNLQLGLLGIVFSPQTCSARHGFKELAKHVQFPQILRYLELLYNSLLLLSGASAHWYLCHVEVGRTLCKAVIHLVAQLGWSEFVLLC